MHTTPISYTSHVAPLPPIGSVLNLLAAGPQTAAYLYEHSGLGHRTGAAIARAVQDGWVVRSVKSVCVAGPDKGSEMESVFRLLPGALTVLRDETAIAAYLNSLCPEIGAVAQGPEYDHRRTRLTMLVSEIVSENDPDPRPAQRDWSDQ